jgi:ribosomal protein S18 acetylase RimI-like enzyme
MNNFLIKNIKKTNYNQKDLELFLKKIDNDFRPKLSSRNNLSLWSKKLFEKSIIFIAIEKKSSKIVAFLSFYCNDSKKEIAYIAAVGVLSGFRKRGLAKRMLSWCFDYIKEKNFNFIELEVRENNSALKIYKKMGFYILNKTQDQFSNYVVYKLRKNV